MATRAPTGQPTRRSVLAAALGAGAALTGAFLGGCRLRLEDDAPSVPFLARKSMPDEQLLVEQYRRVRALATQARSVPSPPLLVGDLAAAHERQAAVLRTVLTDGGVPMSTVEVAPGSGAPAPNAGGAATSVPGTAGASSASAGTASDSPSAPVDPLRALGRAEAEAASAEALRRLGQAGPWRSLLTAIATSQASAATALGAAPGWPAGWPLPPAVARAGLEPVREAVYATEVAAARLPAAERPRFLTLLDVLRQRLALLQATAGDRGARSAPLGYRLPFPVSTTDDASRLMRTVLDAVVGHGLDGLADLPAGTDVTEVVRLQTEASVLRQQWGAPFAPFPGLSD